MDKKLLDHSWYCIQMFIPVSRNTIQVSLKGGLLLQIQRQYIFFPFILVTKTF